MRIKNVIAITIPSILLGACASGETSMSRGPATPAVLTGQAELVPVDPRLPSADRHLSAIRQDAGDAVSALVRVCVTPDGHVDKVNLLHRSASRTYDTALLSDLAEWQFTGQALTSSRPETCENATISYRVPM